MSKVFSLRAGLLAFWLMAIGAGIFVFLQFQSTPGAAGQTPEQWPAQSELLLDPQADTLVMFAHPQCPCTRASLEELNQALARCPGKVVAHVLFVQPKNSPTDWLDTGTWKTASAMPGVHVAADADGKLAHRFGAETSGYVALYNPQGHLLFSGGITSARGHIGDNAGEAAIVSLVNKGGNAAGQTSVFGCSLLDKDSL